MTDGARPTKEFWAGRRVVLTGHTGFKGAWLALWLSRLGAHVTGIGLPPATEPNLFSVAGVESLVDHRICDIRNAETLCAHVRAARPEVVFHLAAQSLVRESYVRPLDTMATNVMGTANLMQAMRDLPGLRVAVIVTTDKVYRNVEQPYPYREDDALGGHDPYSASKAASELVAVSFRDAFLREQGVRVATARAGNVVGGGDWAADRLVPDAVRAWSAGVPLSIRRPQATRPWQHVLEPLCGYMILAERLWSDDRYAGGWNFGPFTHEAATVRTVTELARQAWGPAEVVYGDGHEGPHEAGLLALEIAKARGELDFVPGWRMPETVARTFHWYRAFLAGAEARVLCQADVDAYEGLA